MSWEKYYEKNKGRALRPLYLKTLQFLKPSAKRAVDLGCGVGTEVFDLLKRGFEVHAVDQEPKSIELIKKLAPINSDRLHTHLSSLENWSVWPKADFVFAHHSFPFCSSHSFDSVIEKALFSIALDGIFAASLFGLEDDWVTQKKVTGISFDGLKHKLQDFEILHFEEVKKFGPTALQGDKVWHVIDVIARRLPGKD